MRKKQAVTEPRIVANLVTDARVFLEGEHPEFNGKTRMNAYLHAAFSPEECMTEWNRVAEVFALHSAIPAPTWSRLMIDAVRALVPEGELAHLR